MAAVRRDSRGIVLEKGESQDKSGKYRYRYYDDMQQAHDIYSWRLRPEDPMPEGKRPGLSLREMKKSIQKDLLDDLKAWQGNVTINRLIDEYIKEQEPYWEPSTLNNVKCAYKVHIKNSIGKKKVNKVTADTVERFYSDTLNNRERPIQIGTLELINKVLNAAFTLAVKRNLIRNNSAAGCIGNIKRKNGILQRKKHSLEAQQQADLLEFIKTTPKFDCYYPFFYVLAWTGCRIGELLGLTWYDLDFSREIISINHKITYIKKDGHYQFIIGRPKTISGNREIPMLGDVKEVLTELKQESGWSKISMIGKPELTVKDTRPFIFTNSKGNLIAQVTMEHVLQRIIKEYNKQNTETIQNVTPHTFRHSFCCWLCENVTGENSMDDVKYIQSIMGHGDASTTLNIYSELRKDNARDKHAALKIKSRKA